MSDALPLPPRPNLEQYRKLAKELQAAARSAEPGAIRQWAAGWAEKLARLQGLKITLGIREPIDCEAQRLEQRWQKFRETRNGAERPALADAQFFIARAHGFASWPKFVEHVRALSTAHSPVSRFEAAVDAIVAGDSATLARLIAENPELARARSTREHRSTLLHYVSANGVEDFRQTTPKNIVEIARLLLDAGADVNAESVAYSGRDTTLGLTATSCHPERAGVQLPLMELLIGHGAALDGPDKRSLVNSCLGNGRGQAAEFLARRGAQLDLEGAAGVGRLDLVKGFFHHDGTLKSPATPQQMLDGFAWACQFGRTSVVDFLLQRGVAVEASLRHHGGTGLHWAAYGGYSETVKLLLDRGAPIGARDATYDGTPLDWALHGWGDPPGRMADGPESYYKTVALLVRAGARLQDPADTSEKIRSDPRMLAALRGESPAE
jgi:hypothetical protein